MLVTENIEINGQNFRKIYSDEGFYITRAGAKYVEAIDPIEYAEDRVYFETDEKIENIDDNTPIEG